MLTPKKRLSQNFLAAPEFIYELAEALPLKGELVLEIGAGDGRVTRELASKARKVVAVEIDSDLIPILEKGLRKFRNVEIVRGDALALDYSPYKFIVGSLPYHVASPILFRIVSSGFRQAALVLQAEFAKRLVAKPNSSDYSRLTVMVQAACDCEIIGFIPKECFDPIPKVDSVIVKLTAKPPGGRLALSGTLVTALFSHKNQSVKKSLLHSTAQLGMDKGQTLSLIRSAGGLASRRVRTLSLEEFTILSKKFSEN